MNEEILRQLVREMLNDLEGNTDVLNEFFAPLLLFATHKSKKEVNEDVIKQEVLKISKIINDSVIGSLGSLEASENDHFFNTVSGFVSKMKTSDSIIKYSYDKKESHVDLAIKAKKANNETIWKVRAEGKDIIEYMIDNSSSGYISDERNSYLQKIDYILNEENQNFESIIDFLKKYAKGKGNYSNIFTTLIYSLFGGLYIDSDDHVDWELASERELLNIERTQDDINLLKRLQKGEYGAQLADVAAAIVQYAFAKALIQKGSGVLAKIRLTALNTLSILGKIMIFHFFLVSLDIMTAIDKPAQFAARIYRIIEHVFSTLQRKLASDDIKNEIKELLLNQGDEPGINFVSSADVISKKISDLIILDVKNITGQIKIIPGLSVDDYDDRFGSRKTGHVNISTPLEGTNISVSDGVLMKDMFDQEIITDTLGAFISLVATDFIYSLSSAYFAFSRNIVNPINSSIDEIKRNFDGKEIKPAALSPGDKIIVSVSIEEE